MGVSFETASASVIKNGVEPRDLLCCSIKAIDEVGADRPPPLPMSLEFYNLWSFAQQQFAKTNVRIVGQKR